MSLLESFRRHILLFVLFKHLNLVTVKIVSVGVPMIGAIYSGDPNVGLYTLPLLVWYPLQLIVGSVTSPYLNKFSTSERLRLLIERDKVNTEAGSDDALRAEDFLSESVSIETGSLLSFDSEEMEDEELGSRSLYSTNETFTIVYHDDKTTNSFVRPSSEENGAFEDFTIICYPALPRRKKMFGPGPDTGGGALPPRRDGPNLEDGNTSSEMESQAWSEPTAEIIVPLAGSELEAETSRGQSIVSQPSKNVSVVSSVSGAGESTVSQPGKNMSLISSVSGGGVDGKSVGSYPSPGLSTTGRKKLRASHNSRQSRISRLSGVLSRRSRNSRQSRNSRNSHFSLRGRRSSGICGRTHEFYKLDAVYEKETSPGKPHLMGAFCSGVCMEPIASDETDIGLLPSAKHPVYVCKRCKKHVICGKCWTKKQSPMIEDSIWNLYG